MSEPPEHEAPEAPEHEDEAPEGEAPEDPAPFRFVPPRRPGARHRWPPDTFGNSGP